MTTESRPASRPGLRPGREPGLPVPPLKLSGLEPALPPRVVANAVGMRLVYVPPGEFLMGSPDDDPDARPGEKPQHPVRITRGYWMGVVPVTGRVFDRVMPSAPDGKLRLRDARDGPDHPARCKWGDAWEFCERLSARPEEQDARREYRLPTEAEWEYACRAGTTTRYTIGDRPRMEELLAAYPVQSEPAGRRPPNAFGLRDMPGAVGEWCADVWERFYYEDCPEVDPQGPQSDGGGLRAQRGGIAPMHLEDWNLWAPSMRSASRVAAGSEFHCVAGQYDCDSCSDRLAFRVVCPVAE